VCLSDTPYYHVTSRCVRRAFLCGIDKHTGNSYEHRRSWIEDRIRVLSSLFSVDICAYAVMSNHYHLVVHLNPEESSHWSDDKVLDHWTTLFRGPLLVQRYRDSEPLTTAERDTVRSIASVFRTRLGSLSWFMKCLNEPIARKANAEDQCTGHFWEARFHSQSLCSEQVLLSAMAYVDLNPIRAGLARTPEDSIYTSIKARLSKAQFIGDNPRNKLTEAISGMLKSGELHHFETRIRPLMAFSDTVDKDRNHSTVVTIPMCELDYLRLVDSTGRIVTASKRAGIDPTIEPILNRLGLSAEQWISASTDFKENYRNGGLRLKQPA
jgi:REP element-mobilizing transposase RayT